MREMGILPDPETTKPARVVRHGPRAAKDNRPTRHSERVVRIGEKATSDANGSSPSSSSSASGVVHSPVTDPASNDVSSDENDAPLRKATPPWSLIAGNAAIGRKTQKQLRIHFKEPANWFPAKNWKFGVDANDAKRTIYRGYFLRKGKGAMGPEIRYREPRSGVIKDWKDQITNFDTLRQAEEFLHKILVDADVLRLATADPPEIADLKKRLLAKPLLFVLPTHVSVNGASPLTADSTAKALEVVIRRNRWLSGDILDSYFNMLNRQTSGANQYLHTGVLRQPGGEPGMVPLDDEVEEISQAVTKPKDRIRRSLAKYEAQPHYAYHKKTLRRLIAPVHVGKCHWFLAVVDFQAKKFQIWDSMEASGTRSCGWICAQLVLLRDEVARESLPEWPCEIRRDVLQNGLNDCGVFVCSFATAIARGATPLCVTKEKVQYNGAFRDEMLIALCSGRVGGVPDPYDR